MLYTLYVLPTRYYDIGVVHKLITQSRFTEKEYGKKETDVQTPEAQLAGSANCLHRDQYHDRTGHGAFNDRQII